MIIMIVSYLYLFKQDLSIFFTYHKTHKQYILVKEIESPYTIFKETYNIIIDFSKILFISTRNKAYTGTENQIPII